MKLKMERKGGFDCWADQNTHIENACGASYQRHFLFEVKITGSHKSLNQQGFLVDNNEILAWFNNHYGKGREEPLDVLPSCERIAMAACDHIKELVRDCKKVIVRISGNGGQAWLESEWRKA